MGFTLMARWWPTTPLQLRFKRPRFRDISFTLYTHPTYPTPLCSPSASAYGFVSASTASSSNTACVLVSHCLCPSPSPHQVLFPGVPIEMIVSIGTGYVNELKQIDTMGWDLLVNQLVASSTGTEDTHALLNNLLPKEMYFRFNPQLSVDHPIDEKDKGILAGMKQIARDDVASMETGPGRKEFELMIKMLKGSSR
mmetsp:Transcript_2575/g.5526  ORF Transcript_2575/g.5526 Transcript_2575/m.5526 type:complete len:196 (+) Transcript_2575:1583-2170(+)